MGDGTMEKNIIPRPVGCKMLQLQSTDFPGDTQNNKCPILTVGRFFEYVKAAYQMEDNCDEVVNVLQATSKIDWMNIPQVQFNINLQSEKVDCSSSNIHMCGISGENRAVDIRNGETNGPIAQEISMKFHEVVTSSASCRSSSCECMSYLYRVGMSNESSSTIHYTTKSDFVLKTCNKDPIIRCLEGNKGTCTETKSVDSNKVSDARVWLPDADYQNGDNGKVGTLQEVLRNCASDILYEGLLDSVLPYVLPKPALTQSVVRKVTPNANTIKDFLLSNAVNGEPVAASLSTEDASKDTAKTMVKSTDNEVEIHVCDEAKNVKKDFRCPQKLLVQSMRYFADVTAGQKLEEIDISVHCDVLIFDWLMKWVKKGSTEKSSWPVLESSNVIPIMVSASFLQMETLLDYCVQYCYENMSDILKTSTVLTRLNDDLLTRLAALFSNTDVEALKDKKDKIQSRLFCKLIASLSSTNPDSKKGHYGSLSSLFKCGKCEKIIAQSISEMSPCIPDAMIIDCKGNVCSKHTRESTWTLNNYILTLRAKLRTWRKVYWKLWGDCHFFFCRHCEMYFPLTQMNWCCYHPDMPQFFTNERQRAISSPLGRYPCCGQRAYKFQVLYSQGGCKYKEHMPDIEKDEDIQMLNIFNVYKEVISTEPPQLCFLERVTKLVAHDPNFRNSKLNCKEAIWWDGLALAPPRLKLGLLGRIWGSAANRRFSRISNSQKPFLRIHRDNSAFTDASVDSCPGTDIDDDDDDDYNNDDNDDNGDGEEIEDIDDIADTEDNGNSTTEDSYHSEESCTWSSFLSLNNRERKHTCRDVRRPQTTRCWLANVSVRHNQDNQRDFEEKAAAQMITLLSKRAPMEQGVCLKTPSKQFVLFSKNSQSTGGSYVKVEAEFRDQWMHMCKHKGSFNVKSGVHVKPNKTT